MNSKSSRRLEAIGWGLVRALSIVLFLALWEGIARSGMVTPFMLPTIPSVLERIWSDAASGELFVNLGLTLYRALVGFAIAATGGIVLGMLITRSAVGHWFFDPIVSVGFPMPKIAFLPVVILWLGFYDVTKISMVVLDAIFPVVTATVAGIQGGRQGDHLVGAQHGHRRSPPGLGYPAAGGAAADSHRPAGRAADRADRGDHRRDDARRLRHRRRHEHGLALCRLRAACSPASSRSRWWAIAWSRAWP